MFEDEFEGQVDEYKATEIENQAFRNIAQFIKTEPGKSDYEKKIKSNGSQLMLNELTGYEFCIDNPTIQGMIKLSKEIKHEMSKDLLQSVFESNLNDAKNTTNISAIVAFAVAYNGLCKDKELESYILDEYEKQKKVYMNLGENNYMSFMFNMAEMSNWVNDMALKEKVYKEIQEFEKNEEN